jgi:hypothetical protein
MCHDRYMNTNRTSTRTGLEYSTPVAIDTKLAELQTREAQLRAELDRVREAQKPGTTEYTNRGGWGRAYIVSGGHVHRSTGCSTLYLTTVIYWLTELSGMDEDAIVELAGERACTVCYPSAPVNVLARRSQLSTPDEREAAEARAQRAAEQAARKSKATANAPTASGEPLKVSTGRYHEVFKTERAALQWASAEIASAGFYERELTDIEQAGVAQVAEAVAEKRGVPATEVRAEIETKAAAKLVRDRKESEKHTKALGLWNR